MEWLIPKLGRQFHFDVPFLACTQLGVTSANARVGTIDNEYDLIIRSCHGVLFAGEIDFQCLRLPNDVSDIDTGKYPHADGHAFGNNPLVGILPLHSAPQEVFEGLPEGFALATSSRTHPAFGNDGSEWIEESHG